jgi:hypothetical protein
MKDGRFTSYTMDDGLLDDAIFKILEDGFGNLWMSSNKGVFRVSLKQLNDYADKKITSIQVRTYGPADGLYTKECNGGFQPAGWKGADGRLWFPTMKGVAVVDPRKASEVEPPPTPAIESLLVDHRSVNPHKGPVTVPPTRGDMEITYSAPSFRDPERTLFRYKLHGFDKDWIDAGSRRTAYYTKVPPGKYRFEVLASMGGQKWSSPKTLASIALQAHFYQTVWFYASCMFGLIMLAGAGNALHLRSLAERRRLLEVLIYRKSSDLRQEIKEREKVETKYLQEKTATALRSEKLRLLADRINGVNQLALSTQLSPEQRRYLEDVDQSSALLIDEIDRMEKSSDGSKSNGALH